MAPKPPFDPELAVVLRALPEETPLTKELLPEERNFLNAKIASTPIDPSILREDKTIPGPDGNIIELTVLRSKSSTDVVLPAIYYIHGGGLVFGNRMFNIQSAVEWIKQLDDQLVVISVEYRLAPEHPHPAPVEDCYAGLKWVSEHASELGIDADKIIVAGHSAGGGLAAATALIARDRGGPKLRAQCLICPMLDDRVNTVSSQQYMNEGIWTGKRNLVAWDWMLSGRQGAGDVSMYAAPARATDLSGLPPAWIDVGAAEGFRDENVAYAVKLWEGGVQAELHVWEGAYHGFDIECPDSKLAKVSKGARLAWLKRALAAALPVA